MAKNPVVIAVNNDVAQAKGIVTSNEYLPTHLKAFLNTIIDSAEANENPLSKDGNIWQVLSREKLRTELVNRELPASESLISTRLRELSSAGLLSNVVEKHGDGKNISVYYLSSVNKIVEFSLSYKESASAPKNVRRTKTDTIIQRDLFIGSNDINYLDGREIFPDYYHEGLISGILDQAMRLSSTDKRKEINTHYEFKLRDGTRKWQEGINIQSVCLSDEDSSIMILSDQRCVRVLNTMFIEHIKKNYNIKDPNFDPSTIVNYFAFDIVDVCQQIGLPPSGANLKITRKILSRLKDTIFNIDASQSTWFQNRYGLGADKIEYRYIVEWYAKTQQEEEILMDGKSAVVRRSERTYAIKFHEIVFRNLLTQSHVFISHPKLREDRSGIAQRINNWCKAFIGVRKREGDNKYYYQLDELKDVVLSSTRLDNFARDFISLLKRDCIDKWDDNGINLSLIYGYYFEYNANEDDIVAYMNRKKRGRRMGRKLYPLITIYRNTEDPIVGDNSKHNLALKKELSSIMGESG